MGRCLQEGSHEIQTLFCCDKETVMSLVWKLCTLPSVCTVRVRSMASSTRQFENAGHSSIYAKFRPVPPQSLIDHILKFHHQSLPPPQHTPPPLNLAVDVGCGSGQFTQLLTGHCTSVLATDVSQAQVDQAMLQLNYPNVLVQRGTGEQIDVDDCSVDLVTVCQALHWMDVDKFYNEVNRVLVPGGTLAVIGYHFTRPTPSMSHSAALAEEMMRVYQTTGPYWSERRALVDNAYKTIPMANFSNMERDDMEHFTDIVATLEDWKGYIMSWSGVQTFTREKGQIETTKLMDEFVKSCLDILGSSDQNIANIELKLRTQYWVILYKK